MPVERLDDFMVRTSQVTLNGNVIHLWLTNGMEVSGTRALFEEKHEALRLIVGWYGQINDLFSRAIMGAKSDPVGFVAIANDLADVLDAGLEAYERYQKADEKWAKREAMDLVPPNPSVLYRKMSSAEHGACSKGGGYKFKPTFAYVDSEKYRYWMSTSLAKVVAFGNDKQTDEGDIIVKFEFSSSLVAAFKANLHPHQMKGVQNDRSAVALHREGFAEIGNLRDMDKMNDILASTKNYNLGFTVTQLDRLQSLLDSATTV